MSSAANPTEAPNEKKFRLRLLTFNIWHGLNHNYPMVMLPIQNVFETWKRRTALSRGLRSYLLPSTYLENSDVECLEVIGLQEVNPNSRLTQKLKKELAINGEGFAVNVGVRAGTLSWPLFLEDGVSTFWRGKTENVTTEKIFVSGKGSDWQIGDFPISAQFEERRGALVVSMNWGKRQFIFVNVHLHAGAPDKGASLRRAREVDMLLSKIESYYPSVDAIFVLGDFNCEHGASEISPLQAAGFREILTPQGDPIDTWDSRFNPLTKLSISHTKDAKWAELDSRPKQLDHIFVKTRGKAWGKKENSQAPWNTRIYRIFDGPGFGSWISDHFGLLVDITWTEAP